MPLVVACYLFPLTADITVSSPLKIVVYLPPGSLHQARLPPSYCGESLEKTLVVCCKVAGLML